MPEEQMPGQSDHAFTPPYIPFSTFVGFLDKLAQNDIPPRIDRSVMDNLSGTTQSYLLAALRSFDLVGEDLEVRPGLEALARKQDQRPQLMAELLHRFYAEQIQLGQETATSGQLAESFRSYDLSGETVRKAIRFFLHAADFADIKLSPYFKTPKTNAAAAGRVGGRRRAKAAARAQTSSVVPSTPDGQSHTVELGSGGTVTLSVAVNLFDLSTTDREFVLGLIDTLRNYEGDVTLADSDVEE
jgi:hypothetical protein